MITRETTKRLLTAGGIAAAAAIIVSYSYFASYGLLDGPSIVIATPTTVSDNGIAYASTASSSIVISGVATRVTALTLDGQPIFIDPQGNFSETILLFPGYNIETLQGQDKFGRTMDVELTVAYNRD